MASTSILIVEDDPAIRRGLCDVFRFQGYEVGEAGDGKTGLNLALERPFDIVLLDVLLPGIDGFEVLDRIREFKPTLPIIMVTAKGAETDRVRGLRDGADDYVVKPFGAQELIARVEAVLRRSVARPDEVAQLEIAGRIIDFEKCQVTRLDGSKVSLSERELSILRYLAGCRGRAVTRQELLQYVWGMNPRGMETRTVDMHVARLREKLLDPPQASCVILTIRSKGYRLADSEKGSR